VWRDCGERCSPQRLGDVSSVISTLFAERSKHDGRAPLLALSTCVAEAAGARYCRIIVIASLTGSFGASGQRRRVLYRRLYLEPKEHFTSKNWIHKRPPDVSFRKGISFSEKVRTNDGIIPGPGYHLVQVYKINKLRHTPG
jgi:hypothetical protein